MNSVTEYRDNLEKNLERLENNSQYFGKFGDVYITNKVKEYIDNIIAEMEKVEKLLDEIDN